MMPFRRWRDIVLLRVRSLLRREAVERDLDEELQFHLERETEAHVRRGLSPADARRAALVSLGGVEQRREECRDFRGLVWFDGLARDVGYAFRGLRRQPGFALAATVTIAVGTATLASVLSVVHAVLLRPTPFPNADRIVQIGQITDGRIRSDVSTADVLALGRGSSSLSHVTLAWFSEASLTGDGLPQRARRVYTDWQAFQILGTQPLLGRLPTAANEAPDAPPVVLIGHRLWAERFGSDRNVIGRTLRVNGEAHSVIAVMPADFRFPAPYWAPGDLWVLRGPSHPSWPTSRARIALGFGLLEEGVGLARAQAEADAAAAALDAEYPDSGKIGLRLTGWAETIRASARPRLYLILGAAGAVFFIVCINVANLLFSRGLDRRRELAARVALGAGTGVLVRQLLTETNVLFLVGGSLGVLAATWGSQLIAAMRSYDIPRMEEATVDGTVAVIAIAVTMTAATVVSVVPVLQGLTARSTDIAASTTRGASIGRTWRMLQRAMVAAEVGLALVLLCGAALLLEGAQKQAQVDPGFRADGLLHARVSLPPETYMDSQAQKIFYDRVIHGLTAAPGITAAGAANVPPGVGGNNRPAVWLDGDLPPGSADDLRRADVRVVSPGYLEALGLSPRAGRFFSEADPATLPVAVVNEAFVRQHLDGGSALGRRLRLTFAGIDDLEQQPRTIVAVVGDLREKTLFEPPPAAVYVPFAQADPRFGLRMALVVRTAQPVAEVVPLVRRVIAAADPEQAAFGFMPMRELMESELSLNRLNLALLGVLSTIALFLSIVGVYGVTAQAVRQRTREIGIRLALGGTRAGVRGLLLREAGVLAAVGIALGSVMSIWTSEWLRSVVHGVDSTNASTLIATGIVLAGAVLAACYVPAQRAARIDPAVVLRLE